MPELTDAIEYQAESAVMEWLADEDTHEVELTPAIYHADEDVDTELPRIVVSAHTATEEIKLADGSSSGIYRLDVDVMLHTQADDTNAEATTELWSTIRSILNWDDLVSELSSASLKVFYAGRDSGTTHEITERSRVKICVLTLVCQVDGDGS